MEIYKNGLQEYIYNYKSMSWFCSDFTSLRVSDFEQLPETYSHGQNYWHPW